MPLLLNIGSADCHLLRNKNLNKEAANYVKKLNTLTKNNAYSLESYLKNKLIQKKSINFKNNYTGF